MSGHTPEVPLDLVRRARGGDEGALRDLVERSYPPVRRWALVHTGDPVEADDLTQDVLVRMIRKLDSFHGDARFGTWLYSVTRHAAADRRRSRRRRARLSENPQALEGLLPNHPPDPLRFAERGELSRLLAALFDELPDRQREVFDLVELQGLRPNEVAERLDIEPVSVRAHLFKARRRIRGLIISAHPELVEDLG